MGERFNTEPSREFAGAKGGWVAGQARPAGCAPVGQAAGGALILAGCLALGFVALHGSPSARPALSAALMLWPLLKIVATPLGMLAGRERSARQISLAWRVMKLKARGELSDMGAIASSFGSVAGGLLGAGVKRDSSQDGSWREKDTWPRRLERFGDRVRRKGAQLRGRAERLTRSDLQGLDEIGAWRLAFDLAREERYADAARVWLARPFNPDWKGRLNLSGDGLMSLTLGKWISFESVLEREGSHSESQREQDFCAKTLAIARAAREISALEAAMDLPLEKASEVNRPRRPRGI